MSGTDFTGFDFSEYLTFDQNSYTRNAIFKNEKFELLLVGWMPGQKSAIHDHGSSECIMACLRGCLLENRYKEIEGVVTQVQSDELRVNDIVHINNNVGLHEIINIHDETSISLHLYSPGITGFQCYSAIAAVCHKK
jgi:predicted metal-dependent enzyme (double-stranded beta helix superfamily)